MPVGIGGAMPRATAANIALERFLVVHRGGRVEPAGTFSRSASQYALTPSASAAGDDLVADVRDPGVEIVGRFGFSKKVT